MLDAAARALRPGGRLVVNAVTLETEALLLARHAALGGELIRIAIRAPDRSASKTGWRAAMPVTQWVWTNHDRRRHRLQTRRIGAGHRSSRSVRRSCARVSRRMRSTAIATIARKERRGRH